MVLEDSVFREQSKDQLDSLSALFLPSHPVLTESMREQMTLTQWLFSRVKIPSLISSYMPTTGYELREFRVFWYSKKETTKKKKRLRCVFKGPLHASPSL